MKTLLSVLLILAGIVAIGAMQSNAGSSVSGNVSHGKYIVESVAMCGQCHTPRDVDGNLLRSQWLGGAPVTVRNPYPTNQWAEFAPRIAGLPQYSDEQALTLLTTGISRAGNHLRGPMPPFRMSEEDARDVIAYLRSLE